MPLNPNHPSIHSDGLQQKLEGLEPLSPIAGAATGLRSTDSGLYDVPHLRTKFGERAFSISDPSAWNALPADIRETETKSAQLPSIEVELELDRRRVRQIEKTGSGAAVIDKRQTNDIVCNVA